MAVSSVVTNNFSTQNNFQSVINKPQALQNNQNQDDIETSLFNMPNLPDIHINDTQKKIGIGIIGTLAALSGLVLRHNYSKAGSSSVQVIKDTSENALLEGITSSLKSAKEGIKNVFSILSGNIKP